MRAIKQLGLIFLLCMAAELVTGILPFDFPAGILCMIVLFLFFLSGVAKVDDFKETGDMLVGNMAIFFVPAGVGIIEKYDMIKDVAVQVFLICVISTFITFAVTAYTVRWVTALQKKYMERSRKNV